jgi:sigma-B regulation protein RsbU (phosphoserine phosphatase)
MKGEMQSGFSSTIDSHDRAVAELEDRLIEQSDKFGDVARIGLMITSLLELNKILPAVMETALQVVKAEVGHIMLFDGRLAHDSRVSWGLSRKLADSIRNESGESLWDYIQFTGKSLNIDSLGQRGDWKIDDTQAHVDNLLAVPLKAQDHAIGAMVVANKAGGAHFVGDDLSTLEMLGSFAAVAVENTLLHEHTLARLRMEAELDMARHVQKTLMPKKVVELGRLSIVAHNHMAMQVGGDFYDIIEISPQKYILVVADVSSKGLPAALLMTSTRSLIRAYADETLDLAQLIKNVNFQLCKDSNELRGMFVTLAAVMIDFDDKVIRSVNAGHPPAFLRYSDGAIRELKVGGPFLGQFDDLEFTLESHPLANGSRLFMYTDGTFEGVDNQGKMLGLSRLREFFAMNSHLSSDRFIGQLRGILDNYSCEKSNVDDTTYLLADVRRV